MKMKYRNSSQIINKKTAPAIKLLYGLLIGRVILKVLTKPTISKVGAKYMESPFSKVWNRRFIKKNKIDLDEYEKKKYKSYNDLFTRKIKTEARPIDINPERLISPCDGKLLVYPINKDSSFSIKNSIYNVADLTGGKSFKDYNDGLALIFRLEVNDYHHYCYIDDGKKSKNIFIKGVLHTVQPIANKYNVYKQNSREYTVLYTKNFGDVIQIEIGALMVGKIVNHHQKYKFKKGEEKGLFEFGGSTIVLLIKKDKVTIDSDILENSLRGIETIVKMGEKIGKRR